MGLQLVTPPTDYPVAREEAKKQCRILHANEDELIDGLIAAATSHIENTLDLSLMARTWRLTLDAFSDTIELPRGPVASVVSVRYVDSAGATQTVSADDYTIDLTSPSQWIVLNSGVSWPPTLDAVNSVAIEYVAGFVELPADYAGLKHAILLMVGHWYANREAVSERQMAQVPLAVDALTAPYRRVLI